MDVPANDPRTLLEQARTIAVVGLSKNPGKDAHRIPALLQAVGYRVLPVNPTAVEILGQRAYARLADVPESIDLVNVFRPAAEAPSIAAQAVAVGARAVWLQLGIRSPQARAIAQDGGLAYVEDICAGTLVRQLGIDKRR